jgi:prepilin-type N-terminal cleavage/methylation domain-containing protein
MKNQKGFTFVELLVVITIIAVIFAAGVVSYTTISMNSRNARRSSDLEAVRQALEMCRSIDGSYPLVSPGIYGSGGSIACPVSSAVTMKTTPLDPKPCTAKPDGQYTYLPGVGGYTLTADCFEGGAKVVTNP